jgi:D-beta-D-heptose 7-phosphate kinase/D-beta-D-heptose 1-phosphate adenosyltransferase
VFIDLKKPRRLEPGVALVLLNQRRAEELSGRAITGDKALELVGRHLMARFPCATLVITRGAQGMAVREKKTEHFAAMRTRPWEVFDVTGAGDTVMATLALATVAGATPRQAAALANAAAGVVVGKLGTAVCTPAELLAGLR